MFTSDPPYLWYGKSDNAIQKEIGAFVKHHRLQQNKTQDQLATAAGISRSTLSLLERGETVTLLTLIQLLRSLEQLNALSYFVVSNEPSPMLIAEAQLKYRKRARKKGNDPDLPPLDW